MNNSRQIKKYKKEAKAKNTPAKPGTTLKQQYSNIKRKR